MSSDPVLELRGVSKDYPSWTGRGRSVRGLFSRQGLEHRGERRLAVEDVSLSVGPGELVGLIGGNGAGKSTTLRLAAGLSRPTRGTATRSLNSAAVLTLGETFALDLTGRENAITSAIVAGFSPAAARRRIPEMIAYAEIEDAIDEPVRVYSEGMKLRLAFAVITQMRPDALILDEVMAVGDLSFRSKSQAWVSRAREQGTGILVASHDLEQLATDANRLIWLDHGKVRMDGPAADVVAAYRHATLEETYRRTGNSERPADQRIGSREATIEQVELVTRAGSAGKAAIASGDQLEVRFVLDAAERLPSPPVVAVVIRSADGTTCCSITSERSLVALPQAPKRRAMSLDLKRLDLVPGEYTVEIGVYREDWAYVYDLHGAGYPLTVHGRSVPDGVLLPPHEWRD